MARTAPHLCIVVGSSRGLGAALVSELLGRDGQQVIGVSRTPLDGVREGASWTATGRYRHVALDIASDDAAAVLAGALEAIPAGPLTVVYNAAHVEKDIVRGAAIDAGAMARVNAVGIGGLAAVLQACQGRLLEQGGTFVGITSHWGSVAPLFLPYAAYPATKAYLNMIMRCLKAAWRGKVRVMTVTIGNVKEPGAVRLPRWFLPTYGMAAKRIVRALGRGAVSVWYPRWHGLLYQCVLRFVPAFLLAGIFSAYLAMEARRKG